MTARRPTLALALVLGACGTEPAPAPPSTLHVASGGHFYAATDSAGFLMAPMACGQLPGDSHTLVEVRLTTAGSLCGLAQEHAFCAEKAAAMNASLTIARSNASGGVAPAIGPGTYSSRDTSAVDADGNSMWFWSSWERLDDSCARLPGGPKEGGLGTVTFDEVGPSRIRGSADITFDDGSTLSGPFDVAVCDASGAELCASLKGGCSSVTCVP